MRNDHGTCFAGGTAHKVFLLLLLSTLSLTCLSPAAAQKEKKKKPETSQSAESSKTLVTLSDEQQIDYTLSEMLGAWQLGDVEKLHKDYADDVVVVNGSMQQVRMDRSNTYIKVSGTVGWACYQWDFEAVVDGQPMQSQGQTSVVLEKRNNHWVIALNHTSLASKPPQVAPANAPSGQQQPAKPASR